MVEIVTEQDVKKQARVTVSSLSDAPKYVEVERNRNGNLYYEESIKTVDEEALVNDLDLDRIFSSASQEADSLLDLKSEVRSRVETQVKNLLDQSDLNLSWDQAMTVANSIGRDLAESAVEEARSSQPSNRRVTASTGTSYTLSKERIKRQIRRELSAR